MDLVDAQRDVFLPHFAHPHGNPAHRPSSIFEDDGDRDIYWTTIRVAALDLPRIYEHGVGHGSYSLFDGVGKQVLGPRYYSGGGVLALADLRGVEHARQCARRRRPADDGFERCGALSLICLVSAVLRQSSPYCSHLPLPAGSWRDD